MGKALWVENTITDYEDWGWDAPQDSDSAAYKAGYLLGCIEGAKTAVEQAVKEFKADAMDVTATHVHIDLWSSGVEVQVSLESIIGAAVADAVKAGPDDMDSLRKLLEVNVRRLPK
jgi:hypothetical protein